MEYYSAFKRKEVLTHATTWGNPKNIVLREISQSQTDKYQIFYLSEVPRVFNFIRTESRIVARRWGRRRNQELVFHGYRVSVLPDGNVNIFITIYCTTK